MMRRLMLAIMLLLIGAAAAQAQNDFTLTPNLALKKPKIGSTNWGIYVNGDFDTIDAAIGQFHGGFVIVPFSATPIFNLTQGNTFQLTLTGDVTSSTVNQPGVTSGQFMYLLICQDGPGSRLFTFPASFQTPLPTVSSTGGKCSASTWVWSATFAKWINIGGGGGGGAGGAVNPSTLFAAAYYNTPSTISGIPTCPPTANGQYLVSYDISGSVASAPACDQVGLGARAVTGATATDTVLYTDNNASVEYESSVAVAVSLPTTTTLTNPFFYTVLENRTTGVSTNVTVTPVTFTINGNASLVLTQTQRCLIQIDPALATNWLASCTGGTAGAFPRLDQVLNPTADKTFAMGAHLLTFNGAVIAGLNDPVAQADTGFSPSNIPINAGYSPFISLVEISTASPGSTTSPSGASISVRDTRNSGAGIGVESALQLDTIKTGSADTIFGLVGQTTFVWNQGSGTMGTIGISPSIIGIAVSIENDAGTVNTDVVGLDVRGSSNSGTVLGDWVGIQIGDQAGGSTAANNIALKIQDQGTGASDWAIKTGLGKVQLGNTGAGSLTYNPAFDGAINKASDIRLRGLDGTLMYELEAGNGPAVPPVYFQRIGPPNTASLTGAFGLTEGSRVDLFTGADGAGAAAAQSIFLHHDFCSSTNGSGCYGNQVNLSLDVSDGTNAGGTKQAFAYNAVITNSVNNGSSQGFIADVSCSGTPCTAHAFNILNGDFGLNGSAGTTGQVATSAGPNAIPTWTTPSPPNVFSATQTGQVAAITDTTMVTVGGTTALYRFTGTINCTTTSAAATATLNLKYTDSASTVQTVSVTDTCTALVTSGIPNLVVGLRAKNATAITYGVTIANTPTYDVDVRLEKM